MEEKNELLELCGTVEDIIYRNPTNGYTVMTIESDEYITTAVGLITSIDIGDELKLIGNWKVHNTYGEQFAFDYYEQSMPSTKENILKYLSAGTVKGIGKATAKKIVDTFGEKTLEVIRDNPEKLATIKGISKEKAKELSEDIKNTFGMREIMIELGGYPISINESVRIWKVYGKDAVDTIKENPYVLCSEDIGVEFARADNIAIKSLKKSLDDEYRIRAGIIHVLSENTRNGHTCLPKEKLLYAMEYEKFLNLSRNIVEPVIEVMIKDGSIISNDIDGTEFLFLPSYFKSESYAAEKLKIMLELPPKKIKGAAKALKNFEKQQTIQYAELQKEAIVKALEGGVLILTGGPGTGKTTTLNALIELYKQCGLKVILAAPTGRAAQRMSEVTGEEAKTLHRLLEVEWDNNHHASFKRNGRNLLECDALIIDELSMVDSLLFEGVLRALPLGCRLIMVGDSDQLPSVGAGNVLSDLISSEKIPVVQLTEIFRQSLKSLIVTNAHKIVKGDFPEITRTDNDFFFMSYSDQNIISSKIAELCSSRLPNTYHFSPFDDIQVLCPSRKGELGVVQMNIKLQNVLNPEIHSSKGITSGNYTFYKNDKVMQVKNNYDILWEKSDGTEGMGIFNGDIGKIIKIDHKEKIVYVQFDDKTAEYDFELLNNLELAYATTVHKSQGNEFNAVIIPMYAVPYPLCYRNLLYTAVTRAKKILILIGEISTMQSMIENNNKTLRYSALKYFLNAETE